MNIGILTFHWATNYGAVLQTYALQSYLTSIGHNVKIINYKPRKFDKSFFRFLWYREFIHLSNYIKTQKTENALKVFRDNYLNQTNRINTCSHISEMAFQFDMIISGSDQVANPAFLMNGEGNGTISPAYFLGFSYEGKRIGYALSFGCVDYPEVARKIASNYISAFTRISVRETSGINIVKSMGRDDAAIAPDPTILMKPEFYHMLADKSSLHIKKPYIYCFFLRHIADRKRVIKKLYDNSIVLWNNEDGNYTMQDWLYKIKHAKFVMTDSFHCVVMCLKLHIPFIVITDLQGNVGMNDRFQTLLSKLKLSRQICYKEDILNYSLHWNYNWAIIDTELKSYAESGKNFLNAALHENTMV